MPKALGPQADSTPIHEQVRQLVRQAYTDRMAPVGVTFSPEGQRKALYETVPGMDPWSAPQPGEGHLGRYLGFVQDVDAAQSEDVKLVLVPGGSAEAKAHRASTREQQRAPAGIQTHAQAIEAAFKAGFDAGNGVYRGCRYDLWWEDYKGRLVC